MKKLSNQLKSDYNNAKIAEIGNVLAISDYKKLQFLHKIMSNF